MFCVSSNTKVTQGIPLTLTKFIDPNAPETTKAPTTTKAPAKTTKAPETTKAAESTTAAPVEEKSGCGSSIALTSIALVATVGASVAVVSKKRKDD